MTRFLIPYRSLGAFVLQEGSGYTLIWVYVNFQVSTWSESHILVVQTKFLCFTLAGYMVPYPQHFKIK